MQEKRRSETGEVKAGPGNRARFFVDKTWRGSVAPPRVATLRWRVPRWLGVPDERALNATGARP